MDTIPLLVPQMPTAEQLMPLLREIDAKRHYTNFGPLNARFERRLVAEVAPHLDANHVTTTSNCTVGLELSLLALGLPPGARVLVPGITFVATATAVLRAGMQPVIGEVDADTWVLTPEIASMACLEGRIDAVLPVATFGRGHPVSGWDAFTSKTGIPVLIDAAGAFGNQSVGTTTDVIFSFHATKSFGAAEGGAVLSSDSSRIARIRKLSNFGINTVLGQIDDMPGTNGKLSEYHAALALANFQNWPCIRRHLADLHNRYVALLADKCPWLGFQVKPKGQAYPLLPILLPPSLPAQSIVDAMAAHGIMTRRWYSPSLHLHPALGNAARMGCMRTSTMLGERILGLPFFYGITDQQIYRVIDALKTCLGTPRP